MANLYDIRHNYKVWDEKDKELDFLVDENSVIISNKNGTRILVDKENEGVKFQIKTNKGYIEVRYRGNNDIINTSIGRVIMGLTSKEEMADHINSNPLDNRKVNFRICNIKLNSLNRSKKFNSIYKYKGYSKRKNSYVVELTKEGITYRCLLSGYNANELYAATIYDCLAIYIHKEYAKTNFNRDDYSDSFVAETLNRHKITKRDRRERKRNYSGLIK